MFRRQLPLILLAAFAIAAFGTMLYAVSLPTSAPTHSSIPKKQLLGYLADYSQQMANGPGVATLPTAGPVHANIPEQQLLGYIADNMQTVAARTNNIYFAETYGAVADDSTDDRGAIQSALNAAAATGGVVQLAGGNYKVIVVYDSTTTFDSGTKTKLAGHYGLEIPTGVTLAGAGMYATTITSYVGTDNGVTGGLIYPQGFRSAATAYSAGGFILRDLKLTANAYADADVEICILLGAVHGDGIRCERVQFGNSNAHAVEVDYCRGLVLQDCLFSGSHPLAASGSFIQIDAGLCGPASTQMTTAAAPNADTRVLRCKFLQRPSTDTCDRDIDLNHGTCEIRGLTFDGCEFAGRSTSGATSIIRHEGAGGTTCVANDIVITNNKFTVTANTALNDYALYAVNAAFTTGEAQRWVIANNIFTGSPVQFILAGAATTPATPTAALWGKMAHWQIRGNRFILDQAASITGTQSAMALYALYDANIADNNITMTGTNAGLAAWPMRINSTSGVLVNNSILQLGSPASAYHYIQDSSGAESAVQAATIPGWRFLATGNRSKGSPSAHYYFIGSAVAGGSTYQFQFHDNNVEGTGTTYDLTNQDVGGAGGQILTNSASVDFASMLTGAEDTQTVTVTGCRTTSTGASVDLGWSAALESGIVIKQAWISAANTVSITARNTTAGTINPAALTCRVKVTQF